MYFRRFFLKKSIIDFEPESILISSIFLAFKVLQYEINLEKMSSMFMVEESVIVKNEVAILIVLDYDLFIFCPYKAKLGIINHLKVRS
jgi:cyclin H